MAAAASGDGIILQSTPSVQRATFLIFAVETTAFEFQLTPSGRRTTLRPRVAVPLPPAFQPMPSVRRGIADYTLQ